MLLTMDTGGKEIRYVEHSRRKLYTPMTIPNNGRMFSFMLSALPDPRVEYVLRFMASRPRSGQEPSLLAFKQRRI